MDSATYLAHLRREFGAFGACLAGDLSARVEHCGGWALCDLADHLGQGNMWAAVAVTDKHGDYQEPPAPRDRMALTGWFQDTCGVLLDALDTDPSTSAWTIAPPPTVGFWPRRRCLETLIHRWDAEHALGITSQLDPALAADGIAEVVDTMAPRQVRLGRTTAPRHAIRLHAGDTGSPGPLVLASPWPPSTPPPLTCCSCCGAGFPPMIGRSPGTVIGVPPRPRSAGHWSPEPLLTAAGPHGGLQPPRDSAVTSTDGPIQGRRPQRRLKYLRILRIRKYMGAMPFSRTGNADAC